MSIKQLYLRSLGRASPYIGSEAAGEILVLDTHRDIDDCFQVNEGIASGRQSSEEMKGLPQQGRNYLIPFQSFMETPKKSLWKKSLPYALVSLLLVPAYGHARWEIHVTVTAYTSSIQETDSTPFTTASNKRVRKGFIAVSRDLLTLIPLGTKVYVNTGLEEYDGWYKVEDVMHKRKRNWIDIWFSDLRSALEFGIRKGSLILQMAE